MINMKKEYKKPIIEIIIIDDEIMLNSGEVNFDQLLGLEGDDEEWYDMGE